MYDFLNLSALPKIDISWLKSIVAPEKLCRDEPVTGGYYYGPCIGFRLIMPRMGSVATLIGIRYFIF